MPVKRPFSRREEYERNQRLIGFGEDDEGMKTPPSRLPSWKTVCAYFFIALFLVSLFVFSLLSTIFSGITWDRNCPDCTCPAPLTSGIKVEEVNSKLMKRDQSFDILLTNIVEDPSLRICSMQCYNSFYVCPEKGDVDKCMEHNSVARGCTDFATCVAECKSDCPFRSQNNLNGNVCLNKFNYGLLCP